MFRAFIAILIVSFILPSAYAGLHRDGDRGRDRGRHDRDRGRDNRSAWQKEMDRQRRERERREYWEKMEEKRRNDEAWEKIEKNNREREERWAAEEAARKRQAEQDEMVRNYGRISSVMDVTRKPGGEWLRVQLASPAFLDYFQIMPVAAGLLVHEASLVTASGRRVPMPELSGRIIGRAEIILSDYIRAGEKIITVDVRAESMGGSALVLFTLKAQDNPGLPAAEAYRP